MAGERGCGEGEPRWVPFYRRFRSVGEGRGGEGGRRAVRGGVNGVWPRSLVAEWRAAARTTRPLTVARGGGGRALCLACAARRSELCGRRRGRAQAGV